MTRPSQQTPASPEARAESGAEGRATSTTSTTASVAPTAPTVPDKAAAAASAPAPAKNGAAAAPKAPETGKTGERENPEAAAEPAAPGTVEPGTAEAGATEPDPEAAATDPEAGTADPDPSASAAQSRLPALVRTMTATAIGQPQQEAGPVGRPGKAALAGAAVVGALLVCVPFLVLAGKDDNGPDQQSTAAAGTVLDGSGKEAPGEFAVTAPETSSPAEDEKESGKPEKPDKPAAAAPAPPSDSAKDEPKKEAAPKDPPKKADSPKPQPKKESGGAKNQPAKAGPAVTLSGPVSFRSHLSGRCIDVPGHNFNDGQPLFIWDCNNADAQKFRFASDGTIRVKDKCLDVANANFNNGTRIQLAWCNGNAAQKFALNGAHDLVNTVVGKCVDIPNHSRGKGPETYLILWTCTGLDNQKWST